MKIAKRSEKGESKNRPVATNFQFLKILAPLGQLLVGACLPQTLLERVRQTGILLYFYILYFYFEHNKMFHSYRTKSLL